MTNSRLTLELRQIETDLRDMAMTDYLTGAYNRRSFDDLGRRECARARRNGTPLALLIIDIDHFKVFNDTYGHLTGDELLCALVMACRRQLRQVDLLARWGGEEFAVLLPATDRPGCLSVAEKLRQAVAELTVPGGDQQAQVTISVGGALCTPEDNGLEELLRRADLALYQAKRRGRNCVVIP
jgi:diguanylate cyclase (GGDEF)-like protein